MNATDFLREKEMLDKDKNEFIISFEDGRSFNLAELLEEYAEIYSSENSDR